MPLDEVRRVFLSDSSIYPLDNLEQKRRFFDAVVKLDLLTLSADLTGKLEGFLICYRSNDGAHVDLNRPYEGNGVTVDNVWLRTDLRGDKTALKRLIKAALLKNQFRNAGAEKLFIHSRHKDMAEGLRPDEVLRGPDVFRAFDYPSFLRNRTR